jgi:regulatory protein
MPKIFQMQMRRRRPERFIVTVEGYQEIVFAPEIVLKYGIAPDKEFSEDEILEILFENSKQLAKDQAMRYLTRRAHSRFELVSKMRMKGFPDNIINVALDELENLDLVNDDHFARLFIQNELQLRPVSRMLLKRKLIQRGINREIIDHQIEKLFSEEQELDIIKQHTKKFIKSHSHLEAKIKEKLVRFLQSKGFSWDLIQQVLESEWKSE